MLGAVSLCERRPLVAGMPFFLDGAVSLSSSSPPARATPDQSWRLSCPICAVCAVQNKESGLELRSFSLHLRDIKGQADSEELKETIWSGGLKSGI